MLSPSRSGALTALGFLRLVLPELSCAVVFLVLAASLGELAIPYNSVFYEQDPSLSRERFNATIPTWLLGLLCAALPGVVLLALGVASRRSRGAACGLPLVGLALSLTSTMLATDTVKNFVGSKRPNFFDLCAYAGYAAAIGTRNATSQEWRSYQSATLFGAPGSLGKCTASAAAVRDAQRSFPSGHSSLSFAGLFYLALSLRQFAGVRAGDWLSPAAVACGSPLALATYVAATRVRDNYHREIDVAVGAALGVALALASWATLRARHGGRLPPPLWGGKGAADEEGGAEDWGGGAPMGSV